MIHPPAPDLWKPATLVLTPQPDGTYAGQITWDGMTIHVRGWHKAASGVVRCELQHNNDGWVDREIHGDGAR